MSTPPTGWLVEASVGTATELHGLAPPGVPRRTARLLSVSKPAIVLGSTQPDDVVDRSRALAAGVSVARRRSGGAAVLLDPGDHVWVDLFVPAGDPLWDDDVVAAAGWAGAAWRGAVESLGEGDLEVHRGAMVTSSWSSLVCFAGRGPGEVFSGGRKLVGLSQRRTREWIRVQTAVHRVWEPARLLGVLDLSPSRRSAGERALVPVVATLDAEVDEIVDALLLHLPA